MPPYSKFRRNPGTPWALSALFVLIVGGVLFAGSPGVTSDVVVHDTYYVLPTGAALVFVSLAFAVIGLIYFGFSKLFGRKLSRLLSRVHLGLALIAVAAMMAHSLLVARSSSGTPSAAIADLQLAGSIGLVGLFVFYISLAIFAFNLMWSSFRGARM